MITQFRAHCSGLLIGQRELCRYFLVDRFESVSDLLLFRQCLLPSLCEKQFILTAQQFTRFLERCNMIGQKRGSELLPTRRGSTELLRHTFESGLAKYLCGFIQKIRIGMPCAAAACEPHLDKLIARYQSSVHAPSG